MKTRSAKAKGRRCSTEVRELFLKTNEVAEQDIIVTPSGVNGPDLLFSLQSNSKYPFVIECKNCEKLNIWKALEQAENHQRESGHEPVLFFKRNRSKIYVALDAEYFIKNFGKNK
jgi:hypothetical protein